MDEQERDHLVQQIRKLEQSARRWKLATLALAALCPLLVLASSIPAVQLARARALEMAQREHAEAARAREAAARRQLEQMRDAQQK